MQESTPVKTDQPTTNDHQETDIFAWANNLFLYKEQLKIEVFFMSKNYVLYRTKLDESLDRQAQPLLLDGLLEHVITGAGTGLVVRGFEEAESEEHVLQRTPVRNVEKLVEALNWLKANEHEIERFSEADHDLKRMKGLVVRCSHPDMPQPFYVIKMLTPSQVLKGMGAWLAMNNQLKALDEGTVLRIPADNQLLVVEDDLFVFSQSKLERLFGYNAKKNAIAAKKAAQIEANFNLSFAEDLSLQQLVKDSKTTINKLQKIDPTAVSQDDLLNHAEDLGIELMTDENGAIIIMNSDDLTKFVNLLNDDYVESSLTGLRYEIKSKKLLKPTDDEA